MLHKSYMDFVQTYAVITNQIDKCVISSSHTTYMHSHPYYTWYAMAPPDRPIVLYWAGWSECLWYTQWTLRCRGNSPMACPACLTVYRERIDATRTYRQKNIFLVKIACMTLKPSCLSLQWWTMSRDFVAYRQVVIKEQTIRRSGRSTYAGKVPERRFSTPHG
jgi:hypothetical protein